jgi:hypothetical protein
MAARREGRLSQTSRAAPCTISLGRADLVCRAIQVLLARRARRHVDHPDHVARRAAQVHADHPDHAAHRKVQVLR